MFDLKKWQKIETGLLWKPNIEICRRHVMGSGSTINSKATPLPSRHRRGDEGLNQDDDCKYLGVIPYSICPTVVYKSFHKEIAGIILI